MSRTRSLPYVVCAVLGALLALPGVAIPDDEGTSPKGPPHGRGGEPPWVRNRREGMDRAGGLPKEILALQRVGKVKVPSIEEASGLALAAARKRADALIDRTWHTGRRLQVPKDHRTIQAAIDAAAPRDVVIVSAGTYHELLVMKDGVKLVSDGSNAGDEFVAVEGAKLKLPRRALRTIIDGSKSQPSSHGLIDFQPGTTRHTIVDGFTLQHLPHQNHHRPGHAHGLNVRGASPVVMYCLLQDNGSTGIGNHVVFRDQGRPIAGRDFRHANIKHRAEAVIYANIVRRNLGRGIGCNHFSGPFVLGNEVYANDDAELGEGTGPGIGMKHGAAPHVLGNLVHDNPGGGIVCKGGDPQGGHPIDRPTHPVFECNVAWKNGEQRPCIGAGNAGTRGAPVRIIGNWVFDAGGVGIGVRDGSWAVIRDNLVARSTLPGISVLAATVLELDANRIAAGKTSGIAILKGARVFQMKDNIAHAVTGPRFFLRDSHVGPEAAKAPAPGVKRSH